MKILDREMLSQNQMDFIEKTQTVPLQGMINEVYGSVWQDDSNSGIGGVGTSFTSESRRFRYPEAILPLRKGDHVVVYVHKRDMEADVATPWRIERPGGYGSETYDFTIEGC